MTFPVHKMPLGRAFSTLLMLAGIGLLAIVGAASWLLFIFMVQHVRIV